MTKTFLVIAAIVDLALAALLIGVSGFLFGAAPESMHAGGLLTLAYSAGVIACLAAPVIGFVFTKRGKVGAGLAIAWLPVAGALVAAMLPVPY